MIPCLFRDSKVKKGFVHSRLRRYIPHRVGIEFECFGDFANGIIRDKHLNWKNWEDFEHSYGLIDFSQERQIECANDSRIKSLEAQSDIKNEIRVSICDYRQLTGLYNILQDMAKYCAISLDCGIHIHVDLTKYGESSQKKLAVDWFNRHLHEVESIFPPYIGTYNKRIAREGKSSYVNISNKDTIEFRIAPLTFDYELLITWIVKCCKLVSQMVLECHLPCVSQVKSTKPKKHIPSDFISEYRDSVDGWYTVNINDQLGAVSSELDALSTYITNVNTHGELHLTSTQLHDLLLDRLLDDLGHDDIDCYISHDMLRMSYPDGVITELPVRDAVMSFLDGGVTAVLRVARVTNSVDSNRRTGQWAGATQSARYIDRVMSNYGTFSDRGSYYW